MLQIVVQDTELWDEKNEEFIPVKKQTLQLEHSLISISKWEAKWHKSFLSTKEKSDEESLDYVRCMTLTPNVPYGVYLALNASQLKEIRDYINNPMTATTFSKKQQEKINRDIVTAELIYSWMIETGIPFECQKWHLNQLMTLIRVCQIRNTPSKKMSSQETMKQYAALNAMNRKKWKSKG